MKNDLQKKLKFMCKNRKGYQYIYIQGVRKRPTKKLKKV